MGTGNLVTVARVCLFDPAASSSSSLPILPRPPHPPIFLLSLEYCQSRKNSSLPFLLQNLLPDPARLRENFLPLHFSNRIDSLSKDIRSKKCNYRFCFFFFFSNNDIRRARARISRQWDEDLSRRDVVGLMNKFRAKLLNRLSSVRLYLYGIPVTGPRRCCPDEIRRNKL